jgi:hypothetical protein
MGDKKHLVAISGNTPNWFESCKGTLKCGKWFVDLYLMQEPAKRFIKIMFTSFLFQKLSHLNQFYGTETEFINHLMSGEVKVSIPDLINFQQEYEKQKPELPSEYQIGDNVEAIFYEAGIVKNCEVLKVHFQNGLAQTYDLLVTMYKDDDGKSNYMRLYNIPRLLVNKASE